MGKFLVPLIALIILAGCGSNGDKFDVTEKKPLTTDRLMPHLTNSEIEWVSGAIGLEPKLKGTVSKRIFARGAAANDNLLYALRSKNQFVAAHVLLTKINLGKYFKLSSRHWNHLKVKMNPDTGEIQYDESQIPALIEFWNAALSIKATEAAKEGR